MKIVLIILSIGLIVSLCACGAVAFADNGEKITLTEHLGRALAPDGQMYTCTEFFGGDTSETVKGYIVVVYDDIGSITYAVYVELETAHADGRYSADEIEIDADEINKEIIFA